MFCLFVSCFFASDSELHLRCLLLVLFLYCCLSCSAPSGFPLFCFLLLATSVVIAVIPFFSFFWLISSNCSGCCVSCSYSSSLLSFVSSSSPQPPCALGKGAMGRTIISFCFPIVVSLRTFPFKNPCLCLWIVLSIKHVCFIFMDYVFRVYGDSLLFLRCCYSVVLFSFVPMLFLCLHYLVFFSVCSLLVSLLLYVLCF